MQRQRVCSSQLVAGLSHRTAACRLSPGSRYPNARQPFQRRTARQFEPRDMKSRHVRDTVMTQATAASGAVNNWQLVPLVNSEVSQAIDVSESEILIGSAPYADVKISSADTEHAKVKVTREGLHILNCREGSGIQVGDNELRPGDSTILQDNIRVALGEVAFLARNVDELNSAASATGFSTTADTEALLQNSRREGGSSALQETSTQKGLAAEYGQWLLSLGILYIGNRLLAQATAAAGIAFPSPLLGMFGIIAALTVLLKASPSGADKLQAFFSPALEWIQRWLPVFYVPPLVVLPLTIQGIQGSTLLKMLLVILVGMPASLAVTAAIAKTIREATNTRLEAPESEKPSKPFTLKHHIGWGGLAAATLLATALGPAEWASTLVVPFLLASTVEGLLLGSAIPQGVARFLHPLITCTVVANLGAIAFSAAAGWSYAESLKSYITKGTGVAWGGGDYLMSFLGVVILSFGFRIFGQRRLVVRHAPEIFGSTVLSSAFSLFGTVAFARLLGLAPAISRALAPRSVTVALALPIAAQLNAPTSIAAAGVALTGLLGSNTVQLLLNKLGYRDPIARGLATAGASHGLGTAALAGKEPEALPFCALAYALIGIISTLLVSVPFIRSALLAVAG